MKKPLAVLAGVVFTFGLVSILHGQTAQPLPVPTPYAVVNQDANSRVWERTAYKKAADGTIVARTSDYTELQSGLNFKDPATGQWKPSKEEIDIQPGSDGASAIQGSHRSYFPGDIFQGLIREVTPDGLTLQSRPVGLFFADDTNSVLIAILTNSVGELASSNQVVYPNAFEGADASIRYTYRKAGFEQDVIVQGQLPDPASLGLDPARTRLGMLTVFFDTNNPVVTPGATDAADGLSDSTLTFGKMKIGRGRAFSIGDTEPSSAPPTNATPAARLNWLTNSVQQARGTPTFKRWFRLDGRNYLMEEVPYRRVAAQLKQLPAATARQNVIGTKLYAANSFLEAIPARLLSPSVQVSKSKMTRLARSEQPRGLVLDYVTVNSGSSYTFQSDTTYYVSGACYFGNITLQGGTVIKYANYYDTTAFIEVSGMVTCNTTGTSPAIFTAYDDNTVGETLYYSTGDPSGNYYADPAIYAPGGFNLSNVRISYAEQAVGMDDIGSSGTLSDSQLINCQVMAVLGNGYADAMILTCNNCLFVGPSYYGLFAYDNGYYEGGDRYNLNNCTVDNAYYLAVGTSSPYCINATNCVFANGNMYVTGSCTEQGGHNGFYYAGSTFGSPATTTTSNPFQTSGSDGFYLAAGSTFRNAGTTGISSTLLADLQTRTTYALSSGGWPDTDTPDLGWHYALQDGDADGLPDWWELYWFGNLSQTGSSLDASGNTLLTDYQNYLNGTPTDPNVIQFSIEATNDYVSHTNVSLQLNVTAGVPNHYAVFVGGSGTTNWLAFTTTNLTVNVGATDGVYDVNVGLKGFATNATQTWNDYSITVDRLAPVVTVTNPVPGGTVIEPYVQLQGFANEHLMSLSYDISNATGVVSNQPGYVTDQAWDTNKFDYTTNYFQCYDVPLTNGTNRVTLRVTDRAGNMTTTNFNVTLNYSGATNPVVSLTWPTNGMEICGSSFTLRGMVDDPCASVSATITDTNGDATTIAGEVERSGVLWVENLPLAEGTNWITLDVTNAAGHSSEKSISVVKSDMTLCVTNIDGDLWNPTVNVSGLISPYAGYTVTVNGVQGTNNGDGTWEVDNVPVSSSGVASFDMSASSGGGDPYANMNVIKDAEVRYVSYHDSKISSYTDTDGQTSTSTRVKDYNAAWRTNSGGQLNVQSYLGTAVDHTVNSDGSWQNSSYMWSSTNGDVFYTHYTDNLGADDHYTNIIGGAQNDYWDDYYNITGLPDEDLSVDGWLGDYGTGDGYPPTFIYHYFANNVHWHLPYYDGSHSDVSVDARTLLKLFTGGKAGVHHMNLIQLQCWGEEYGKPDSGPWMNTMTTTITPSTMRVLGQPAGSDGNLWVMEPDNAALDLNLSAPPRHYDAWATPTKYEMTITASTNGTAIDLSTNTPEFCVGQNVTFTLNNLPMDSISNMVGEWQLPTKYVNEQWQLTDPIWDTPYGSVNYDINSAFLQNTNQTSCWFYNGTGGKVVVGMNLLFANGQSASIAADGRISIFRPTFSNFSTTNSSSGFTNASRSFLWDGTILSYGDTTTGENGQYWSIDVNSKYNGAIGILQLVNAVYTRNYGEVSAYNTLNTGGDFWLDGSPTSGYQDPNNYQEDTYLTNLPASHRISISDQPEGDIFGLYLGDNIRLWGQFTDYLRFQPDGAGSIAVTLATNTWSMEGMGNIAATVSSPNNTPLPSAPSDSDAFPTWTQVKSSK